MMKILNPTLVHLIILIISLSQNGVQNVSAQNWLIRSLLPTDYDKLEMPSAGRKSDNEEDDWLTVNASIYVNSFTVTEMTQTVTNDMIFCLNWTDFRVRSINFPPNNNRTTTSATGAHFSQIRLTNFNEFWRPTVYFRNALSSKVINSLTNIEYVQVWPNRKLLRYCSRMQVTFVCHMEFANFPFDEHNCHLELQSLKKTAPRLRIQMITIGGVFSNAKFSVRDTFMGECYDDEPRLPYPLRMRKAKLNNRTLTKSRVNRETAARSNNCAYAGVRLRRTVNYYVIRYYWPTFVIVICSFANFWMPTNAWPARTILMVNLLVTLITISQQAYDEAPSNDVAALYWWLWVCQFFIYAVQLEYLLSMAYVNMIDDKKVSKAAEKGTFKGHFFGNDNWFTASGVAVGKVIDFMFGPIDHYRNPVNRSKVDYASRLVIPFAFLLFVLGYIVATIPVWANK